MFVHTKPWPSARPPQQIAPATAKAWEPPCLSATREFPATSSPPKGSFLQQLGQERYAWRRAEEHWSSFPWQNDSKSRVSWRDARSSTLVGVKHWMVQHLGTLWAQNPLEIHFSLGVHHGKDATLRAQPGQSCLKTCSMSIDAIRESRWKPELIIWNPIPPHPTQSLSSFTFS